MTASPMIIGQARMTSTRLPGKVLLPVAGRPMLAWLLDRLRAVRDDVGVAVATTTGASDDAIVELCATLGVPVVRGSEQDVLDRYHQAAAELNADPVIRITSDCPLIDPATSRAVLELWERVVPDYAQTRSSGPSRAGWIPKCCRAQRWRRRGPRPLSHSSASTSRHTCVNGPSNSTWPTCPAPGMRGGAGGRWTRPKTWSLSA